MFSSILFDFGGTLDADGLAWLDRFYDLYPRAGLANVPKSLIKEAFYWAEAQAELDPAIKKAGFREMMERHVRWQFTKLGLHDPEKETAVAAGFYRPAERILHRNRHLLERLHQTGFRLGVVSNFYGNVEILCREFGYCDFLSVMVDTTHTQIRKPDPAVYHLMAERLEATPAQCAMVGDSFERDIAPAKAIGMTTVWLVGDRGRDLPPAEAADHRIYSLDDLPSLLERVGQKPFA
jgi:HAD superfamily hydrolase (TIGR01509 family)